MKPIKLTATALFLTTFIPAIILEILIHAPLLNCYVDYAKIIGIGLLFIGLTLNVLAYRQFQKHQTSHHPFSSPKVLLNKGIYAYTRNPIYLALCIVYAGIVLIVNSVWLLSGLFSLIIALKILVIKEEEMVLHQTFGKEFEQYCKKTRRWI
jgi:protein-S-isoprenylcysteine O-methyltransferase Ste14